MNLIRKFLPIGLLILSFFLLSYTYYKSEIIWSGLNRNFYIYYYVISLIFVFFSLFTFYISNKTKDYLIIIITSIAFSAYSFELFLTYQKKIGNLKIKKEIYKKETGKIFDDRSKFQVYKDLKKMDKNVVMVVPPNNHLNSKTNFLPLSGVSNSMTVNCNENGEYFIFQSDRHGFNNPDNEWDNEQTEYLLVGDSYTLGACVNRPHDMASILRILSKKPVLNLGYNGNGPLLQYAALREYLDKNVKKILWFYFENNDLEDLTNELKSKTATNYLNNLDFTQNLKINEKQINSEVNKIIEKQKAVSSDVINFLKIYNTRLSIQPKKKTRLQKEYKEILNLANSLAEENSSKLYFIYLPTYERYIRKVDNTNYQSIKKMVEEINIPFLDMHEEVFLYEEDPLNLFPFKLSGHYNMEGYKKISTSIFKLTN